MTVVVVGSINVDDIYEADALPAPGETVIGARYQRQAGGKGANQAVAAAFEGKPVRMVGMVGPDGDGERQRDDLEALGVDCSGVGIGHEPTGRAAVMVGGGENQIMVASGANHELGPSKVSRGFSGVSEGVVLISAEVADEAMTSAAVEGWKRNMTVVVNAAPARPLPSEITAGPHILVVNEPEARLVSAPTQITTLGAAGVRLEQPGSDPIMIPALVAREVLDTTGAGDAFCGVFAASLADGRGLEDSVRRANAVASAVVRLVGARTWRSYSLPDDVRSVFDRD
ncbi:MAG: ribokinase [Acidimicrobiia bacterium]|nr:ribokinase [Acidimicrobiia bacterium]